MFVKLLLLLLLLLRSQLYIRDSPIFFLSFLLSSKRMACRALKKYPFGEMSAMSPFVNDKVPFPSSNRNPRQTAKSTSVDRHRAVRVDSGVCNPYPDAFPSTLPAPLFPCTPIPLPPSLSTHTKQKKVTEDGTGPFDVISIPIYSYVKEKKAGDEKQTDGDDREAKKDQDQEEGKIEEEEDKDKTKKERKVILRKESEENVRMMKAIRFPKREGVEAGRGGGRCGDYVQSCV